MDKEKYIWYIYSESSGKLGQIGQTYIEQISLNLIPWHAQIMYTVYLICLHHYYYSFDIISVPYNLESI